MSNEQDPAGIGNEFISFLDRGLTPYHVGALVCEALDGKGFHRLMLDEPWDLESGASYYVRLGDAAVIAVRTAGLDFVRRGAVVFAAHSDSPSLRVKEQGIEWKKGYLCIPTEMYGHPIVSTWFDRDLTVCGRLVTASGEKTLVELPDRVVIPNVALHLNRKVNEGFKYNAHDHVVAVAGASGEAERESTDRGVSLLSLPRHLGTLSPDEIWEADLFLSDGQPASASGSDGGFVFGPRIDDLAGVFTNLHAFLAASPDRPLVFALYNHEEIGSLSGEGAQSGALQQVLGRMIHARGGGIEEIAIASSRSLIVSNDVAHALHPSFAERYDANYAPLVNGGPVLKQSGILKYATTAETGLVFRSACEAANVPMQRLVMRSDVRPGSTVGPVSWARTGIPTVDVGLGILAMHSIRETAGLSDIAMMIAALKALGEA